MSQQWIKSVLTVSLGLWITSVSAADFPTGYSKCAEQGSTCTVKNAPNTVAYGIKNKWVYKYVTTSTVSCDTTTFGSDPYPGVTKKCSYNTSTQISSAATATAVTTATKVATVTPTATKAATATATTVKTVTSTPTPTKAATSTPSPTKTATATPTPTTVSACSGGVAATWPACTVTKETCVSGSWGITNPDGMPAVQYQTSHFALRWNGSIVTAAQAQAAGTTLELVWSTYMNKVGFTEPYCDSTTKYKVNIHIDSTFGLSGGVTGTRDMGMWIGPASLADHWGLAHEFAHALQGSTQGLRDSPYVGWLWENHANWMTHQLDEYRSETHCSEMLVNFPHLYYGSTRDRYCSWQFLEYVKDKYCYKAVNDIWTKSLKQGVSGYLTEEPMSILARNQGWSASQLNDLFGEWAMHNVNWDYRNHDGTDQGVVYRAKYGAYSDRSGDRRLRVTQLDPLDLTNRRFNVPAAWAPQRWGYNLVRLYPDTGASTVKVTFRGVVQTAAANTSFGDYSYQPSAIPTPDSDWRWGVVALDANSKPRYSALQRGSDGELSFCLASGDKELWLVVVGTPKNIHKIIWDQMYYTLYRYPWMVQVSGAMPEGFQTGAANPTTSGARHANGGGWVATGASVASTAYVGPYAVVLGGTVSGNARIEDHAVIHNGTVSGSAVVGKLTQLKGNTVVKDNAKVGTVFMGPGAFETGITLSGTAQLYGDVEERGASLSKGVFYGFVDSSVASDTKQGASRTTAPVEVTAPPTFTWRP